jgi:hypothetical protein
MYMCTYEYDKVFLYTKSCYRTNLQKEIEGVKLLCNVRALLASPLVHVYAPHMYIHVYMDGMQIQDVVLAMVEMSMNDKLEPSTRQVESQRHPALMFG